MNINKENLLVALAVVLVIGGGIYLYNKNKSGKVVAKKATQSLEGKTIYNPNIVETEGKVWTLIDGKWYAPLDWTSLPDKKEDAIISQSSYTKDDFLLYPKGGLMDYSTLPQFR